MNALPDYKIIEFFDWIKKNMSSQLNIGFVRECVWRDKHTKNALEGITPYAKEFINQKNLDIEPYELAESIRFYLSHRNGSEKEIKRIEKAHWDEPKRNKNDFNITIDGSERTLIHMMQAVPAPLHMEIEFLEWLLKQQLSASDIIKMPMSVFEKLAKEFSVESKGVVDNNLLSDLLQAFKLKDPHSFVDKIKRLIRMDTFGSDAEKYKSIAELFCRYSNSRIVKCFFLPLAHDKMFEAFINDSWIDLNLAKDYLDIYYSVPELSASGYKIKEKFSSLKVAEDALPCIVLWINSIEDALCVELRDLQYNEIFHLVQSIVQNIKCEDDFETIHAKAKKMADEKRKKQLPISIIEQKFDISNSEIKNSQLGTFESKLCVEEKHNSSEGEL